MIVKVDEPTSGLDSSSSKEVIGALRNIAVQHHLTIATVIHQPRYEIFTMFHKVLLLGKGGRTVYLGPSEKALTYFESIGFAAPPNINPADFMMDVIAGEIPREGYPGFKPQDLFELWEENKASIESSNVGSMISENNEISLTHQAIVTENKTRKTSFLSQLWMLIRRGGIQVSRDIFGFVLDVVLVYIAGLSLGVIFSNSLYIGPPPTEVIEMCGPMKAKCGLPLDDQVISIASLLPLGMALCGVMSSLSAFGDEKIVFLREYQSNLSPLMYFISKNIVQIPIICITPAILMSIFFIVGKPLGSDSE